MLVHDLDGHTAYHESGHALAGILLGFAIKRITIEACRTENGTLLNGAVTLAPGTIQPRGAHCLALLDTDHATAFACDVARRVVFLQAGIAAEDTYCPGCEYVWRKVYEDPLDYMRARSLLGELGCDPAQQQEWFRSLDRRSHWIMEPPAVRKSLDFLVHTLLRERTLEGEPLHDALRTAHGLVASLSNRVEDELRRVTAERLEPPCSAACSWRERLDYALRTFPRLLPALG